MGDNTTVAPGTNQTLVEEDLGAQITHTLMVQIMSKLNEMLTEYQPQIIGIGTTVLAIFVIMFISLLIILGCNCIRPYNFKNLKRYITGKASKSVEYQPLKMSAVNMGMDEDDEFLA